jgi:hypothetical protein
MCRIVQIHLFVVGLCLYLRTRMYHVINDSFEKLCLKLWNKLWFKCGVEQNTFWNHTLASAVNPLKNVQIVPHNARIKKITISPKVSRDSAVGIATGYGLDDWEVGVRVPVRIITSPYRPDRLWGPPNLLYNGYRELFPGCKAAGAWSWPLTSN